MIDVQGTSLTSEDKDILAHPLVGGFILFSRNFESPEQISQLTKDIRQAANANILIAVDHEGGRVQRFRQGFSQIPAMGKLLSLAGNNLKDAQITANHCGSLMALEVQAVGIDISFAPVLDINGISEVIGDRAFDQSPKIVSVLAEAFINGMNKAGMLATGKHFPGHGSVKEDSHIALPVDKREKSAIYDIDILPFKNLINKNVLAALMPAHVIYPHINDQAVGFSPYWLQQVLRKELAFDGVIFSDDLSMQGAAVVGGYIERAEAAQQAGCDMLLTCNDRAGVIEIIDNANINILKDSSFRLQKLLSKTKYSWSELSTLPLWQQSQTFVANLQ